MQSQRARWKSAMARKAKQKIARGEAMLYVEATVPLDFERDGVALSADVVGADILQRLAEEFAEAGVRVGARPFALSPTISELIGTEGILTLKAKEWSNAKARPVRVLAFDKTPEANWHLPWHQDRVIAVKRRVDLPDYGHWTVKNGEPHVEAPAHLLETMFNLRLHVDDCDAENGALRRSAAAIASEG